MTGIFLPVFIHFCVLNMLHMMRLHLDAASLTTMAALISLPFFLYFYRKDREKKGETGWGIRMLSAKEVLAIAGCAIAFDLIESGLLTFFYQAMSLDNTFQEDLFESRFLIQIIGLGVIGPVMEEVLFRGLVYQRLKAYNEGWFTIFLAAAFFAVYHGNAVQIIFAFPMAIVIIGIYEKCGTLLAPILFHIIVNLTSVFLNGRF